MLWTQSCAVVFMNDFFGYCDILIQEDQLAMCVDSGH